MMKYSYNDIMEPWYPEEFKVIDMDPIKKNTYAISNYGRVMNINTKKILVQIYDHGYKKISLSSINSSNYGIYLIHILVAYHFIPKTEDDIANNRNIVNHKNFIKSQNFVHNLEWVNYQENMMHYNEFGHLKLNSEVVRRASPGWSPIHKGEEISTAKLTKADVITICKLLEKGCNDYKELCNSIRLEYNPTNKHLIYEIARGNRWKHISCNYNIGHPKDIFDYSPYVQKTCELLEQNLTPKKIIIELGLEYNNNTRSFVNRVKRRIAFSNISKNYNF